MIAPLQPNKTVYRYEYICTILSAIQPILSTGLMLTKYDIRKYVKDLITLTYCSSTKNEPKTNKIRKTSITKLSSGFAENLNNGQPCVSSRDDDCERNAESDDDSDADGIRYSIFGHVENNADSNADGDGACDANGPFSDISVIEEQQAQEVESEIDWSCNDDDDDENEHVVDFRKDSIDIIHPTTDNGDNN